MCSSNSTQLLLEPQKTSQKRISSTAESRWRPSLWLGDRFVSAHAFISKSSSTSRLFKTSRATWDIITIIQFRFKNNTLIVETVSKLPQIRNAFHTAVNTFKAWSVLLQVIPFNAIFKLSFSWFSHRWVPESGKALHDGTMANGVIKEAPVRMQWSSLQNYSILLPPDSLLQHSHSGSLALPMLPRSVSLSRKNVNLIGHGFNNMLALPMSG